MTSIIARAGSHMDRTSSRLMIPATSSMRGNMVPEPSSMPAASALLACGFARASRAKLSVSAVDDARPAASPVNSTPRLAPPMRMAT